ncbi:MAG: hypothetical protein K1X79_06260 [Oligoflexia bacterium]|nr:hypothetical protein [Oligoflexia bacterium]
MEYNFLQETATDSIFCMLAIKEILDQTNFTSVPRQPLDLPTFDRAFEEEIQGIMQFDRACYRWD